MLPAHAVICHHSIWVIGVVMPVGGVMQGRGLDPFTYIMATNPLHRAIMQRGRGLPIRDCTTTMGPVGTLGLVDDTAVLGSNVED